MVQKYFDEVNRWAMSGERQAAWAPGPLEWTRRKLTSQKGIFLNYATEKLVMNLNTL